MALLARGPTFPTEEVERIRGEQLASILQRRSEPRGFANELIYDGCAELLPGDDAGA